MTEARNRFFVITGGPGSGKSTLVAALGRAGYSVSPEAGRQIIQEQVAISGCALPWANKARFAEAMLARDIESYRAALGRSGDVFFDRGIPDVLGYATLVGLPLSSSMDDAAQRFRYHRRVFIAPFWPDIFTQDAERKQTPDEAERTFHMMERTYAACGYELEELPRASVDSRLNFVRERCRAWRNRS
jgi:predicted ATPase